MSEQISASIGDVAVVQSSTDRLILDVLPPEHFEARRIPSARNACVYEVTFLQQVSALADDKKMAIIVYGAGEDSLDAVTAAEKLGRDEYENVAVFHGGLPAWKKAGKILEGTHAEQEEPAHPVLELRKNRYNAIPEESTVSWTGRNYTSRHTGTVAIKNGVLDCEKEDLQGSFTMAMESIANADLAVSELQPVLEAHLKSDDFFFVSRFPSCTVEITSMRPIPGACATMPNYSVQAVMTLRGNAQSFAFEANLRPLAEGRIALMANFDLDRTQWGVIYGSARFFKFLSYHIVFDIISIDLRVVLE